MAKKILLRIPDPILQKLIQRKIETGVTITGIIINALIEYEQNHKEDK